MIVEPSPTVTCCRLFGKSSPGTGYIVDLSVLAGLPAEVMATYHPIVQRQILSSRTKSRGRICGRGMIGAFFDAVEPGWTSYSTLSESH